jgi:hypothetical protein
MFGNRMLGPYQMAETIFNLWTVQLCTATLDSTPCGAAEWFSKHRRPIGRFMAEVVVSWVCVLAYLALN